MSGSRTAGDFLKGLSAQRYARISELLDESIDMTPGDREIWLAALERNDPQSAVVLRSMFAARRLFQADRFLEEMPVVPRKLLLTVLVRLTCPGLHRMQP
jgi:hypothetical protein